jgi:alkaline phosphatase D
VGITGDWDQRITRRTLLKTGGSLAAGMTLAGIASGPALGQAIFADNPFTLGIASGDPSPTGVVLWTRLAPDPLAVGGGMPAEPFEVRYELSQDEDFHAIVRKGSTVALPDEAHSVREEIQGLGPEHHYFYRFKVGDWISPVGHTRTRPPGNSMVRSVTFAFVSCQNFAEGYFTPYDDVADAQDIEAVIFLGDYIYEGRNTTIRTHMPQIEVRTLDDYRIRHGQYKTDEGLQKAHAAHPWLVTWDDHEFENNYADEDLDPDPPGGAEAVRARRAAAYRAYWEHMPLARPAAVPALHVGPDGDVQRARRASVPLRPAPDLPSARRFRILRREPRALAHDARRRAARLAAGGPRHDQGALEHPGPANGVCAVEQRGRRRASSFQRRR